VKVSGEYIVIKRFCTILHCKFWEAYECYVKCVLLFSLQRVITHQITDLVMSKVQWYLHFKSLTIEHTSSSDSMILSVKSIYILFECIHSLSIHIFQVYTLFKHIHLLNIHILWVNVPSKCIYLLTVYTLWTYTSFKYIYCLIIYTLWVYTFSKHTYSSRICTLQVYISFKCTDSLSIQIL